MNKLARHGMLLGKFLPPHAGHIYLGEFAQECVEHLTIVVGTLSTEPICGDLRYEWMKELFPKAEVIHLKKDLPQDPSEHPDFWNIWRGELQNILPHPVDLVFASEQYGHRLAKELNARFFPVDPARSNRNISATKVRHDPFGHWEFIPRLVRPYFIKRICVFGPESTGKSTLAHMLAQHFNTVCVHEYARTFIEELRGEELQHHHLVDIAKGQLASEATLARDANKILISDTDVLSTTVWEKFLFDSESPELHDLAQQQSFDLYILTEVDVPWVDDVVRYLPDDRTNFHHECEATLLKHKKKYVKISGSWERRNAAAIEAVQALIDEAASPA